MRCHGAFGVAVPLACLHQQPTTATAASGTREWADPSPHRSGFVAANGLSLHYLDWGGAGEPLLLAGLFGSAHAFDELYLDASGHVKALPASMTIAQELIASGTASPPDYAAVKAPALALFAVPVDPDLPDGLDADLVRRARAFHDDVTLPMQREQIEWLREQVPEIAIVELRGTTHTLFMSEKRNEIVRAMRDFLTSR